MELFLQNPECLKLPCSSQNGGLASLQNRLRQRLSEFSAARTLGDFRNHRPADVRVHGDNGATSFSSRLDDHHRLVFTPCENGEEEVVCDETPWDQISAIKLLTINTDHDC